MEYEFLEHTADVKFKAYGGNLREAFENAGKAMFDVMVEVEKVNPRKKKEFKIKTEDLKALLYDFLEELIILHEIEGMVFSKFKVRIKKLGGYELKAGVLGEKLNREKHGLKTGVKAVTYHEMKIHREENNYWVQVVLDV